jgi:hypothetical protein
MMTLRERIKHARAEAFREAKDSTPWVFGRGTHVATVDANGDQCDPWPGADPMSWDGKVASLAALVAKARTYPKVAKVVIEGGYDGAETMEGRKAGDYDPWISSWSVVVWERTETGGTV